MSLDPKFLELLTIGPFESKEEEEDCKRAKKLLPLRKRGILYYSFYFCILLYVLLMIFIGNLILCTILLGNVAVNALFSILISDDAGGAMGFIISTVVITIFGEILPQSIFKRFGLKLAAHFTYLLYFFLALTFVIAFPIAAVLDKCLGEELGNVLSRNKMKRMFEIYEKEKLLTPSERKILSAALEMSET